MSTTAIQEKKIMDRETSVEKVSWKEFKKTYLSREDEYKYEWVEGRVEKTMRSMDQAQISIALILIDFFYHLKATKNISGTLMPETDSKFNDGVHRRPDLAYFSTEQLPKMAHGENQIPEFVIEVVSKNDQINRLQAKMKNYRDANVKVVWQIFPKLEEVHVYRGMKMEICSEEKICSAAPVLPDFELKASDIFVKPPKPKK